MLSMTSEHTHGASVVPRKIKEYSNKVKSGLYKYPTKLGGIY